MQMHTASGGAEVFPPKVKEPHILQEVNGGLRKILPWGPPYCHTSVLGFWPPGCEKELS